MQVPVSTPMELLATILVVALQVVSFLMLLVTVLQFRRVASSRSAFYGSMEYEGVAKEVHSRKILVLTYVVLIVGVSIGLDLLYVFQPHFL